MRRLIIVLNSLLWILREAVCDRIPRSAAFYESVKLGSNPRVIIERPHANGNLIAFRPVSPEQAGTAIDAKGFHRAFALAVGFDELFALK